MLPPAVAALIADIFGVLLNTLITRMPDIVAALRAASETHLVDSPPLPPDLESQLNQEVQDVIRAN